MNIDKKNLSRIISEEIQLFEQENAISFTQLQGIVNKVLKKLDSIDMSLDLVYGAIAGGGEAIAVTRARQAALGRAAQAPAQRLQSRTEK